MIVLTEIVKIYKLNDTQAKELTERTDHCVATVGLTVVDHVYQLDILPSKAEKHFASAQQEIDGGIAAYGLYKDRYRQLYETSPAADTLTYLNHQVQKDIVFSGKVSFYQEGPEFLKGLDIYAGFGWQMRFAEVLYGFNEDLGLGIVEFGTSTVQYDYMGPEFHLGLEYAYFDLPISAFLEGAFSSTGSL